MSASRVASPPPLWLLTLVTFCGTLAMHVFVPALPTAAADLGAAPGPMQLTISFYIGGLAIGQLVYGPLADRFGRRPLLLGGLGLFALAGGAAALAPGVEALIAARLVQALGGCAGLVLGRAIVRDVATTQDTVKRLALLNLMVTFGPGLAPLVGTGLSELAGWRSIFVALALLGLASMLLVWRLLPETRVGRGDQSIGRVLRSYGVLLRSPAFLGFAFGGGCATTAIYAFIAAAPFIFVNQFHRPPTAVGVYLAIVIAGLAVGSIVASRLARIMPVGRQLILASLVSLAASSFYLATVLGGIASPASVVGAMVLFGTAGGIAAPAAIALAMSVNPALAGSASGAYGFIQMTIGAGCTALVGLWPNPSLASAWILALASLTGLAALLVSLRHSPQPS